MNIFTLILLSCTSAYIFHQTPYLASAAETSSIINEDEVGASAGQDVDKYYNLEEMTDEELEEICTSRGFELVRDDDDTIVYTHQDYVDAANECLQIEADLEEILATHPEILEDVKKESERMMNERNRLLEQLQQQQLQEKEEGGAGAIPIKQKYNNVTTPEAVHEEEKVDSDDTEELLDNSIMTDTSQQTQSILSAASNKQPLSYDVKEIAIEVIQQIKSDITKLINLVIPKRIRDQIKVQLHELNEQPGVQQLKSDITKAFNIIAPKAKGLFENVTVQLKQHVLPALKSFSLVVKEWSMTAVDMGRRYIVAFMNKGESANSSSAKEKGLEADDNDKKELSGEEDVSS